MGIVEERSEDGVVLVGRGVEVCGCILVVVGRGVIAFLVVVGS